MTVKKKQVAYTLSNEILKQLEEYSNQTMLKKSNIVELALKEFFKNKQKQ
ncbi:MAG: ribbon-helix-helix domain-containing protein [Candidatus Aenigmatarchaeota archaeon]